MIAYPSATLLFLQYVTCYLLVSFLIILIFVFYLDSSYSTTHRTPNTARTNIKPCSYVTQTIPRLHWRIRNCRRSSRPEDRGGTQWPSKQVRCHIPPVRRRGGRNWEVDCVIAAQSSIWTDYSVDDIWYYDAWGGEEEEDWGESSRLLLLKVARW